nr:MAG TPA: hypothetical protein [Caudoviricetes sp.]
MWFYNAYIISVNVIELYRQFFSNVLIFGLFNKCFLCNCIHRVF